MNSRKIIPQSLLNMVPISRTPWGGSRISEIKSLLLSELPPRIGESWEISTGNPFPSKLRDSFENFEAGSKLEDVLAAFPDLLGNSISSKLGSHSPLLLKWLHAEEVLSVQVHPALGDSRLEKGKEGKPESWLVMECEAKAKLYFGFKAGFSEAQIIDALATGCEEEVLYSFTPQVGEYICVPPGCIHAIGPGVLVAEPQYVLPGKEGVTLRVSDWGRRYNEFGAKDPKGNLRETHLQKSIETIDWQLPRGDVLRSKLCKKLENGKPFEPPPSTPFPVVMWNRAGDYVYQDLVPQCYSVATVWSGEMVLSSGLEETRIQAGETAFVSPSRDPIAVRILPSSNSSFAKSSPTAPGAAFFSVRI